MQQRGVSIIRFDSPSFNNILINFNFSKLVFDKVLSRRYLSNSKLVYKQYLTDRKLYRIASELERSMHRSGTILLAKHTSLTWNITTLPPLSPVARSSPSWLNSTQEIRSASVTSSSRVPFTWLKHHVVSPPLPGTASPSIKNK